MWGMLAVNQFVKKNPNIKMYRIVILPFVLYGRKILFPTLRDGHRLRLLYNRMLRKTFKPKRAKVVRESRKLHNEELYNL
jgi:hypothetical protein